MLCKNWVVKMLKWNKTFTFNFYVVWVKTYKSKINLNFFKILNSF